MAEHPPGAPAAARAPDDERCSPLGTALRVAGLAALCVAMTARVLRPGTFPFAQDTISHDIPVLLQLWEQTRESGSFPLWTPWLQNGLPTIGSFAWGPLHPSAWLLALNFEAGFRWQWPLAFLCAGLGMAAWGRAAALSRPARWLAAVAFALTGHVVTLIYPGHLQKVLAIAWLPWAMAGVEWALGTGGGRPPAEAWRRTREGAVLCGVALALQALASHLQILWITLLMVGARGGFAVLAEGFSRRRAPADAPAHPPAAQAFARLVAFPLIAGALAFVLGAGSLLPGMEMSRISNRASGVEFAEAVETSYPPTELLEYAFPRIFGDSLRDGFNLYSGEWGERLVTDYVGVGVFLLAITGLFAPAVRRRPGLRASIALILTGATILALGRFTPAYRIAYELLPGLNRFRSPGTQMVASAWCFAALAGLGWEALAHRAATATAPIRELPGRVVIALLGALALVAGLVLLHRVDPRAVGADSGAVARAITLTSMGGSLAWGGGFALALALSLALLRGPALAARPRARAAVVLLPMALIAADLIVRLQPFFSPEPAAPYLQWLRSHPVDAAIARIGSPPRRLIEVGNELTLRPMHQRISVPMGYHPVSFAWQIEAMRELGLDSPLLRAIWAVNFVRTPNTAPPDTATTWTLVAQTPSGPLWRAERPNPFARWPRGFAYHAVEKPLAEIEASHGVDPARPFVLAERDTARCEAMISLTPPYPTTTAWAVVLEEEFDQLTMRVASEKAAWLVLSMPPAPGWEVWKGGGQFPDPPSLGGAGTPLGRVRADAIATGIIWPGGEDFLHLAYRPWSVRLGFFLGLLGLGALAAFVAHRLALRRK